ncbi:unnamed protein product [Danaus chrysippus]|uniref:(African queen) hypothetical protein n=1 Tax=Danaus chrysippus TaxID=151541 RepID=A0A8J2QYY7_9NEOP|nr:unnamed protein product [Danaus chrysippus]
MADLNFSAATVAIFGYVSQERAAQRVANENNEQRERHLQDLRQRTAENVVSENDEQRERLLAALRVANEKEDQQFRRTKTSRRKIDVGL